jgi:putative tryptophan/tyrosine transport system ATP-binding protein
MIRLENIDLYFNRNSVNENHALKDISVQIEEKQFTVVIGPNGSGKTSLLNCIAGTAFPQNGNIYINGTDIRNKTDYQRALYISRIFQNPLNGTAADLSIIENFRLAFLRSKRKGLTTGTGKKFENLVKEKISFLKLGLENDIYKPMGTLSGGQRQALTLVMAIMDDCKIILLDEPTAALDPRASEIVMEKTDQLISTYGLTALLVTHHLKDAIRFGNRLLMMKEGKIVKDFNQQEKQIVGLEELAKWFD